MIYEDANKRAKELTQHLTHEILMCNDRNDLLILSFTMINFSKKILDDVLGCEQRKKMFEEHTK